MGAETVSRGQPPVFIMLPAGRRMGHQDGAIDIMADALKVMGVVQFVASMPCVALGVAAYLFKCEYGYIAAGIWVGAMVLVAGVLGIYAGACKEQCPVSSFHMLSILNILSGTALLTLHVVAALQDLGTCADATKTCPFLCLTFNNLLAAMGVVLFFLALTAAIVSIGLNRKISKRKDQVIPLMPYPYRYGNRPETKARPGTDEEQNRRTAGSDIPLNNFDFSDDNFKFP